MSATEPSRWAAEPFVMGSAEQFAALVELFARVGYTEPVLASRAGVASIYNLPPRKDRQIFIEPSDALSLLVQLFLDGTALPWSVVRSVFGPSDLATIEALGLLHTSATVADACIASVALYPDEGLYLASDRHADVESVGGGLPPDAVYSALTGETHRFVELMPRTPCGDYLELCSGTGVAALIAARSFADRAWAIDITERSTRFAEFNAALNDLKNVTALAGDLYAPVAGQRFDMISAHPPYVPSFETEMVFRDGGEDGEQITRRIIAGLGEHLRPGGEFYCDCLMTDRAGAPLEQRIREMLGPLESEFDVLLGQAGIFDPSHLYADGAQNSRLSPEVRKRRRETFTQLEIERFVTAACLIRRRSVSRTPVTRRRIVSSRTRAIDFQWYLDWSAATVDWDTAAMRGLLDARPKYVAHTELHSRSTCQNGEWEIVAASLATDAPFAVEASCPPWFATFLGWCDGRHTVRAHLERLRDIGLVAKSASEDEFAILIRQLADAAFLELDLFPLPPAATVAVASAAAG